MTVRTLVATVLIVLGLVVSVSGAVGILRMPDVYLRVQTSSKTVTLGVLPVLLGLVVAEGPISAYGGRALIVAVLLLVMNPLAAHALLRAAYRSGVPMWPGAVVDQARRDDRARHGRARRDRAGDG